jgi:hypothetical protein
VAERHAASGRDPRHRIPAAIAAVAAGLVKISALILGPEDRFRLVMRSAAIGHSDIAEWLVSGRIDRDGTVRARISCWDECIYDVVWQKEDK